MVTVPSTTIKVPAMLRDRLNDLARENGGTMAEVIERLLKEAERAERFRAIRTAWNAQTPGDREEYAAEFEAWERASLEDLEKREPPYQ